MKHRRHWFLGPVFVLPAVALLMVLSSLQLASADVKEAYTLKVQVSKG